MKQQQKLTISMAIFFLITFVLFGTIVLNEKKETLFMPKIEEKLEIYLKENYKDFNYSKTNIEYKNNEYIMKVTSSEDDNLYFSIKYKDKTITDTYKEDYIKGKSYISYIETEIEKGIEKLTKKEYQVTILTTLDSMTSKIKEKILTKNNLTSLKIYNLETEIPITTWSQEYISNEIINLIETNLKNNINAKNYTITITNINDLTQSIKITNLNDELKYNDLITIINDIINNEESSILKNNNKTYEYLN